MFINFLFFIIFFTLFLETLSWKGLFKSWRRSNNANKDLIIKNKVPISEIYQCAQLSELAYEFDYLFDSRNNPSYLNIINKNNNKCPNCKFIKFIKNKTNLHCLITENKLSKKYIIIFKGTSKLINWYYNIKMNKINLDNSLIHKGFYLQLMDEDVIGQIDEVIKNAPEDYELWFCGHSAGGAHSVISSYLLAKKYPDRRFKTYTFASPRIGDNNFAEKFNKMSNILHWRTSYRNDMFTALPIYNYKHVGKSLRLYPNKIEVGDYNLYTFSVFKCHSLLDHQPEFYTEHLKKLL